MSKSIRASYRDAIHWIAINDEPTQSDPNAVAYFISVLLVADLWKKEEQEVAAAVIRKRKALGLI